MNPKPFLLENHFTVPLIFDMVHLCSSSSSWYYSLVGTTIKYTRPVCVWWRIVTESVEKTFFFLVAVTAAERREIPI